MGEGVAGAHGIKEFDEGGDQEAHSWAGGDKYPRWARTKSGVSKLIWVFWVQKIFIGVKEQIQEGSPEPAKDGRQSVRVNPDIVKARQSQGGTTPESFGCIGRFWRTRGRCHQESSQEGSGGGTRTTHRRTHQGGHQTHLKVKDGFGDRERIVGGQSRPIDTVGSTSSAS